MYWYGKKSRTQNAARVILNCALIIAAGSLSQVMWFLTASAIADVGVLVADILVWIVSAYALIIVTKARSNDLMDTQDTQHLGLFQLQQAIIHAL